MELTDLLLQLKQVESEMQETKDTLAPINEVINGYTETITGVRNEAASEVAGIRLKMQEAIEKIQQDAYAAIAAAETASQELKNSKWDMQTLLRKQERDAESLRRQIEQAKRINEAKAEWSTLEQRWDLLTAGAPWREWAKDHQIDGAKKITYEGRLILGDTMGLGKTLTSLIAIDMIEAATKDASPEFPVEFGVK